MSGYPEPDVQIMSRCNACGSPDSSTGILCFDSHGRFISGSDRIFSYKKCSVCGNLYLSSMPGAALPLSRYYEKGYYGNQESSFLGRLLQKSGNRKKLRSVLSCAVEGRQVRLLDIGCGDGNFLSCLPPERFDAAGVEPNPEGCALAEKRGLEVTRGTALDIEPERVFDVITMWHVLEHIQDPVETMRCVNRHLSPDGVLIVSVPNSESLGFKLGKEYWFHMDAPRHLFLPALRSMEEIAVKSGFQLSRLRYDHYDFPLDLFWSIRRTGWRCLVYPLYPLFKIGSRECMTLFFRRQKQVGR